MLSGRVAVYGPSGERTVYGPGQSFAAGWAPYWTVNETDSTVELLVTFLTRPQTVSSRAAAWGRG